MVTDISPIKHDILPLTNPLPSPDFDSQLETLDLPTDPEVALVNILDEPNQKQNFINIGSEMKNSREERMWTKKAGGFAIWDPPLQLWRKLFVGKPPPGVRKLLVRGNRDGQ